MLAVTQAHKKCVMKIKKKQRKNDGRIKFFDDRKDFVWLLQNLDMTYVDEFQVNNSSHTKGTTYLSSKWVNGLQKDGFLSVGTQMGTIKLTMPGT